MAPICGINRGETLPVYQFGHKILSAINKIIIIIIILIIILNNSVHNIP